MEATRKPSRDTALGQKNRAERLRRKTIQSLKLTFLEVAGKPVKR